MSIEWVGSVPVVIKVIVKFLIGVIIVHSLFLVIDLSWLGGSLHLNGFSLETETGGTRAGASLPKVTLLGTLEASFCLIGDLCSVGLVMLGGVHMDSFGSGMLLALDHDAVKETQLADADTPLVIAALVANLTIVAVSVLGAPARTVAIESVREFVRGSGLEFN